MSSEALTWLENHPNPSIRYRTLRDLKGEIPPSLLKREIEENKQVKRIFNKMDPQGYWLYRGTGESIDYAMSSSTHFVLSYLAELGLDKENPVVDKAVNRYLNLKVPGKYLQPPDHATGQSCLYAYNLRTFILMGYKNDSRIQERIETLEKSVRKDDGYLCRRSSFNENTKSCIRGTVKALMAYAELPELWNNESCQRTVNYFLKRNIYFKSTDLSSKIRGGMYNVFPFVINTSLLEVLYALSRMGYGKHPALKDAWETLESRNNGEGKYILDWCAPAIFNPGKKGEVNPWVTLYAFMAKKASE